jgi:hypothetical protein
VLDCETPRGQVFLAREQRIAALCAEAWHATVMHAAPPRTIDALFAHDAYLYRVAEIKTRDMTWDDLQRFGSYLVTFDKLLAGRDLGVRLQVEYVLVVGLLDATVWWPITDAKGAWTADLRVQQTETRATCNGGSAVRANAYVCLRGVQRLRGIE